MTCPDPRRSTSVVTVCHESDYAVVVFFENAEGRITLLPL